MAENQTVPPTMKDVAKLAGVARSTVSLALRNDPSIPPATRSRIFAAAKQVGYRTNPLVSALMTALHSRRTSDRHTVLAYVTSDPEFAPWRSYQMFIEMHAGARQRAIDLGYRLEEFSLSAPGMTPARYAQMLKARGILGLLIAPLPHDQREITLDLTGFTVVGIDMSVAAPKIERVSNDHFQSAMLAVEHCRRLGYRRIGYIISQELSVRLENRWLAALQFATQCGPARDRVQPLMPPLTEDIPGAIPAWYAKEKPDVVIMSELNPHGRYALPRKVGLVSLSLEEPSFGRVAGIFQDNRRMGSVAIEHLVARLERCEFGPDDRGRLHLLAGRWCDGSSAPGRNRDRTELV